MSDLKDRLYARLCTGAMASFRKAAVRLCPDDIRNMKMSFSQNGEDLVLLDHLLNYRKTSQKGIYIDAGCFDPFLYSNTRILNLHGWRGINIDAARDVIGKYNRHRPSDHNVCSALSDQKREMILSGTVGTALRKLVESPGEADAGKSETVRTTTLAAVLDASPFRDEPVDVLDIDCELHDLAVLRGFPFDRRRPLLVCIEAHTAEMAEACNGVLETYGYLKIATRGPTLIYRDKASIPADWPPDTRIAEL